IAQPFERVEQAAVVALMQPDRGLVQDIKDADEARADLRGQADALPLASGQRPGWTVQRQVLEADVGEEAEPLSNLLEHAPGDGRLTLAELQRGEERRRVLDGEPHDVGDRLVSDLEAERLAAQPGSLAHRTPTLGHERLDLAPGVFRFGLAV